jgi:hypothetical protein
VDKADKVTTLAELSGHLQNLERTKRFCQPKCPPEGSASSSIIPSVGAQQWLPNMSKQFPMKLTLYSRSVDV